MAIFELELSFSADLTTFLRRDSRDQGLIRRMLAEKTAVKDIIEACGVPHSEVDLIVAVETHGAERYGVHFWLAGADTHASGNLWSSRAGGCFAANSAPANQDVEPLRRRRAPWEARTQPATARPRHRV